MKKSSDWKVQNNNFELYVKASIREIEALIESNSSMEDVKKELLRTFRAGAGDTKSAQEFYAFLKWRFTNA